ncbi:TPA: helix-turn-helix domain-containing protein [Klebsiella pneumoniae]|uniref:helix-turn-helix domain-containing protein n=2 Tax=Serratia marcescens TaxID=615 RepID=UPI0036FB33CA|nr:helix-turn-helix domain-containing protein [Klebsiella pneumoniae]
MTGFELKLWRTGLGWTQEQAAKEFGISMRTYIRYEHGNPPRAIELAIQALSLAALLPEIDVLPAETLRQRVRMLAIDNSIL